MPNIKFSYLFRDSANYKKFDSVIFANSNDIDLSELEKLIRSKLISDRWFYADLWKLPELFFEAFDFKIDPTWHEFERVEYTDEPASIMFDLNEFIATV
jgi:hypothetical protein